MNISVCGSWCTWTHSFHGKYLGVQFLRHVVYVTSIYQIMPEVCITTYTPTPFPGGTGGKGATCQCRRCKRPGFDPRQGRSPGESHGQRNLVGYSSQGHKESDTTEATFTAIVKEGHIWFTSLSTFSVFPLSEIFEEVG